MVNTHMFKKDFTREHSLFYSFLWSESNQIDMTRWLSGYAINVIFIRDTGSPLVSTWYLDGEFDENKNGSFAYLLKNKLKRDINFINKIENEYKNLSSKIYPYFLKQKNIKSISELKEVYQNIIKWWSPMAMCFCIPEFSEISEEIKQKALSIRTEAQHFTDKIDNIFFDFFTKNYPQYLELITIISPEEVFNLDNNLINIEEINKRANGYIIIHNSIHLINNKEQMLHQYNYFLESEKNEIYNDSEMRGSIAQSGIITGRVVLVLCKDDMKKVKNKDVLVTIMTTPDFLPVLDKASAIITDEGGITCHAAIIARELKIPCIIGTKIATRKLKDNDLVEVDANNGIIKIIERIKTPD